MSNPAAEAREIIQRIRAADDLAPGSTLGPGDHIGVWVEGEHPYGKPAACPFCSREPDYTSFFYNGPGRPPQYAFRCGDCGAQGPTADDAQSPDGPHIGARRAAVREWNTRG